MVDTPLDDEDIDISRANHVIPNVIKKYQANKSKALNSKSPIDADVMDWLIQQDEDTQHHVNEVIRHFIEVKRV